MEGSEAVTIWDLLWRLIDDVMFAVKTWLDIAKLFVTQEVGYAQR